MALVTDCNTFSAKKMERIVTNRRGRGKVGDDRGAVTFEYYPHTYLGFVSLGCILILLRGRWFYSLFKREVIILKNPLSLALSHQGRGEKIGGTAHHSHTRTAPR